MKDLLIINNLNYLDIFSNLTLTIKENEYVFLSGANNSGKTTLIRIINKEIRENFPILINNKLIDDYKIDEYKKLVETIIPLEISFKENTLEKELLSKKIEDNSLYEYFIKKLKLSRLISKKIKDLTDKEIVIAQIIIALLNKPKLLLIDSIDSFFSKEESKNIHHFLIDMKNKFNITIIETSTNLDNSINLDRLLIIQNGKIVLDNEPIKVLEKDNILNKIGLKLPFMIDLSVKLRDYDLVKEIELEKDRMVDILWK